MNKSKYHTEYNKINKEKIREQRKLFYLQNKDRLIKEAKEQYLKKKDNPEFKKYKLESSQARRQRLKNDEVYMNKVKISKSKWYFNKLATDPEFKKNDLLKAHKKHLYKKYKLTKQEYDNLNLKQNFLCKICGLKNNGRRLCVDHCHRTGKIRGLLCSKCNLGLGHFDDDIIKIEEAIKYLNENK